MMTDNARKGVLLINLGTPNQPTDAAVRQYLKEFLNDPRVVDLPLFIRWLLMNGFIIPFRYKKSAEAYRLIWQEEGSPLLVHSLTLRDALAAQLGEAYNVVLAMRYGQPAIATALHQLRHCQSLFVLPLFPQYTSAATGSALEQVLKWFAKQWHIPQLKIKTDFYQETGFINAYAEQIRQAMHNQTVDFVLFSYHGLPVRHIIKSDCKANCDRISPCPSINQDNQFCYRAQCYATTEKLAQALSLPKDKYQIAFQSRLGRTPWIKPYTDEILSSLTQKGIKNIAIVCPSFVADCLETLEEINIRARAQWQALGGEQFIFVPCINATPLWVNAIAEWCQS